MTSDTWDLAALKSLLKSAVVSRQVGAFSVQMRGGSVRYQAQTLRRVGVPRLESLSKSLIQRLARLADTSDNEALDGAAEEAYRLK